MDGSSNKKQDDISFSRGSSAALDHISFNSDALQFCKVLGKVDSAHGDKGLGFPDGRFSSDHILLVEEFSYLWRQKVEVADINHLVLTKLFR